MAKCIRKSNDNKNMSILLETDRLIITEMTMDMAMDVHKNSLDEDTRRFVPDEDFGGCKRNA